MPLLTRRPHYTSQTSRPGDWTGHFDPHMLLSKEYVGDLAREVTKKLIAAKAIETSALPKVTERVHAALLEELTARSSAPHQRRSPRHPRSLLGRDEQDRRQLPGDVPQSEERTGAQIQGGAVRLSRDKVNVLARAVADALKQMDEVDFIEDPNTIRQETRKILEELLNHEERIDQAARLKIESQKRTILEGSQEWDILYRKYYNEEVKKLGI